MNAYQQVNRKLKATNVKLFKGRGYQYFKFDDGARFETQSLYWFSISENEVDYLVKLGREFAASMIESQPIPMTRSGAIRLGKR